MKKKLSMLLLLIVITIACNSVNEDFKNGTFELYEKDTFVGILMRMNNFQVEKYEEGKISLISKLDYTSDSTYLLSGTEINAKGVDTTIFLTTFKKLDKNKYKITGIPYNFNLEYKYEGVLIKTKNNIKEKYVDTLNYLNRNHLNVVEKDE